MDIIVLGTGCPNCKALERITRNTIEELGIDATITKEEDIMQIMEYGVMHTPALVVDEKVIVSGRVPSKKELIKLLTSNN
jgi:small redox-active disulfide protein 2